MNATPEPALEAMARLAFSSSDLDRFLAKIDTSGSCWIWTGGHNGQGYGQFHKVGPDGRRQRYAHRLSYQLFVGPIPDGMSVDHTCERGAESCVTPWHLRAIPIAENTMAASRGLMAQKARQTHCVKGHPLNGANLYIVPSNGRRACHTCRAVARAKRDPARLRKLSREYQRRKRAERYGSTTPPDAHHD